MNFTVHLLSNLEQVTQDINEIKANNTYFSGLLLGIIKIFNVKL